MSDSSKFWVSVVGLTLGGVTFIGVALCVSVVAAIPTFYLWNWLMPAIFGVTKITFLQAIGINVLCECLFKARSTQTDSV